MVVGDAQSVASASGASMRTVRRVTTPKEAVAVFGEALPVLDIPLRSPVIAGQPSSTAASAIIRWIETAVGLALSGAVSGVVTAPIAKEPLYAAGFGFPGHTEFLGELTQATRFDGARGPIMMLAVPGLRTTLVTVHEPIAKLPQVLNIEKVVNAGLVTAQALRRDFGIEATGPTPADSLFPEEMRARYDAALCMYHDQALIPVKMLDFWGGVNVTLGLPIVRTSPDHGTAFDIAGRGLARPDSLVAAIRLADEIAARRAA